MDRQQRRKDLTPCPFRPRNHLRSPESPLFTFDPRTQPLRFLETPVNASPSYEWAGIVGHFRTTPLDSPRLPEINHSSPVFTFKGDECDQTSKLGDSSSLFSFLVPSPDSSRISPPSSLGTMVVEREPPKAPVSPSKSYQQTFGSFKQPEFGKASPLQNPLHSNVFNIPKAHKSRPEHHRVIASTAPSNLPQTREAVPISSGPVQPPQPSQFRFSHAGSDTDVVEIPRPVNAPIWNTYPAPPPKFPSQGFSTRGYSSKAYRNPGNFIDLTDTALFNDRFSDNFGDADPLIYVDAAKANENIKALLEGAFEDEEDKPKTRGRKKKLETAVSDLTSKLQALGVKPEENPEEHEEEEEEEEEEDGTVDGLKVKLLPHQVSGVEWMKEKEVGIKKKNGVLPKGGILADDMGLGKTIQSISLILSNPRPSVTSSIPLKHGISKNVDKGTLVVAPLALIKQWEAEIKNRVSDSHELSVRVHHGPQRTKRFEDLRKYDVVITTYQILVSEHGNSSQQDDGPKVGCYGLHWYRVILDEAHTIKNRNAKATQACYNLRAEYRWCLTGTPMQNNLDELQSLIKFLRIKPYDNLPVWRDQITRPMNNGRGGVAIKRLQFYLKAFMKRRTKDVLKKEGALNPGGKGSTKDGKHNGFKITERRIEKVVADFAPGERRFYERLEQRADKSLEQMMGGKSISYASALVLLLRLRQACNHPQLVGGSMAKDRDALTTGQAVGSQTPRKTKVADKELDDMADLLGGLSVETKKCDVCQIELVKEEMSSGSIRCSECEEDLASQNLRTVHEKKHKHQKSHSSVIARSEKAQSRTKNNRRVILDSSDEEEDGDWIVPSSQRSIGDLGKAGGTDDENAEGGGESLASEDSDSDDDDESESDIQVIGSRPSKTLSLNASDAEEESDESSSSSSKECHDQNDDGDNEEDEEPRPPPASKMVPSTKIRHLLQILHRESATQKFIVFSQFTSMLDLIEPFLQRDGLIYTRYDGSMRNDLREASLERLRTHAKTRILLCSLKCGSLGLNLTAASRVVILEPFWNPFVEEQAIDRVHRLNQTVDVIVYKLTIADSVEERILDLQEKKRALAEAAVEGRAVVGKLSMKDILNLFRREAEEGHHGGDLEGKGLVAPVRVLGEGSVVDRGGKAAVGQVGGRVGGGGRERERVVEDSVYGRRW